MLSNDGGPCGGYPPGPAGTLLAGGCGGAGGNLTLGGGFLWNLGGGGGGMLNRCGFGL